MIIRESGMPEEATWREFFDADAILKTLKLGESCGDVAEFGCGYGTFTLPAAKIAGGIVHAFDIESDMVRETLAKAEAIGLGNVHVHERDFVADGMGLPASSVDYAMLFNILHAEYLESLLQECRRVLRSGGHLGIVHWDYDPSTPRGPSMSIRPRPKQ